MIPPQSWIHPNIAIKASGLGGKGVFAINPIALGEKVLVWGGVYVHKAEAERAEQEGKLVLQWDDDLYSVEDRGEDDAYFINHSCDPNVWMGDAFTLIARRNISTGEELVADYALWEAREDYVSSWDCNCGAKNCRGKVRGTDWMLPELQNLYAGHFSPLLNKRIFVTDELGVQRGTVRLVAHNPNWKVLFEEEKELLLATFPNTILKISHGGSTAIPNIPAKPIIDMFAVVRSLSEADAIKDDLEKLGYEYVGERGVPERRLAVKGPEKKRTHHLQFVQETSKEWTNHILIREYYLKHPEVAEEYARLKQDLAQKYSQDRASYTNGKEGFIASVIERAKEENKL